ncbi:MAG: Flp pilus assembly complex ATPase component TadA [Candidatus Krumholzibacteriota bacterium]|nr:Flp pilus assembly complex ATPase component TadA [Candidatus Krumholzibacteriota bacterium]
MESKVISSFLEKLGEELVGRGLITRNQLDQAGRKKMETGENMGEVLVRLGFVSQQEINKYIGDGLNIPHIELEHYDIDPEAILLIDEQTARKYRIIPLFEIEDVITIAMVDPFDIFAIEKVRGMTNKVIEPVLASENDIMSAIDSFWGREKRLNEFVDGLTTDGTSDYSPDPGAGGPPATTLENDTQIINLVNSIFNDAVTGGASDIHLEPEGDRIKIRFRVDGILREASSLDIDYHSALTGRIKFLARMDIGQRRLPLDGKIHLILDDRKIDLRVSTYPVVKGEKILLHILDPGSVRSELDTLGISRDTIVKYRETVSCGNGVILVTGPTGSGKTTTLYSTLNEIKGEHLNIMTIEDPVEYEMSGVNQGQVDEKAGITFSSALRAIVHQDPDVILVGEIRDPETAALAVRAGLTGHLVFSALHTDTAAGAISRLRDRGVEPFLLASTIRGILGQRLVRLICSDCREEYRPSEREYRLLGLEGSKSPSLFRGAGCKKCNSSGYRGRIGIYELLIPDREIRELILSSAPDTIVQEKAVGQGMVTLRADGADKVLRGLTTCDEVIRVS